uniref:Uncharacterized protein n=1 Tax=Angiostrongylus cantonensis TaxID=6313 RepID=A0A0K0DRG6_ANGCA
MVTICTYNARTLAPESSIEDLLMQARMIRYVIGLAETRRRHPFNAVYDTGEELFLGKCDSRGAPTSNYDEEEVEALYMDLEKFYKEDHTFFKVIIGEFNARIGPRRTSEECHFRTHG